MLFSLYGNTCKVDDMIYNFHLSDECKANKINNANGTKLKTFRGDNTFCLTITDSGRLKLKEDHPYYYQVIIKLLSHQVHPDPDLLVVCASSRSREPLVL